MKKTIALFILASVLFAGCAQTKQVTQQPLPATSGNAFEQLLASDTGSYEAPIVTNTIASWKNPETNSSKTGFVYTYVFKSLGIKVSTPAGYEPYFSTPPQEPIFKQYNHMIYATKGNNQYLEVLEKETSSSLEQEIITKHLPASCTIYTGIADANWMPYYPFLKGYVFVEIVNKDGSIAQTQPCHADKTFPTNNLGIVFFMNPQHPEKYYKLSYGECAPGPCHVFGTMEFF